MIATQTIYEEDLLKIVRALPPVRAQQVLEFAMFMQTRSTEAIPTPAVAETPLELMRLPLAERRRLLALQAEQMVDYYEQDAAEREQWQGGDIVEY